MTPNPDLPLVTIITPTYNRADYLPEVIDSVLSQDYPNLEYIVLDDGSKDNTVEVLERYAGRIIWESHTNMGEAKTVNKGFAMATGEIIAIVNSDDPILPGLVRAAVNALQAHPSALVAYPDWVMIDPQGRPISYHTTPDYDFLQTVREHYCMPGPGAFIRRRALVLVGGRSTHVRYVGDYDFWLRLGLHGDFIRIPQTLATWRDHPNSASSAARSQAMAEEHLTVIRDFYAQPNLPEAVLRVKDEAFSSAYYAAGLAAGGAAAARKYYSKSIQLHRNSRLRGEARSWKVMLASLLLPGAWVDGMLRRRHAAQVAAMQEAARRQKG
ncbi:MAG: glycosyltransferase family 2 protein [bacterium]|nr:glycosyltransferase family 2 protein [bacterium]